MNTEGNGHSISGEWSTLTLPDSGNTLEYRRVSHMLIADVEKSLKPPRPPMQEVDYGGNKRLEANPNHPDHLEALREHRIMRNEKLLEAAVKLGVRVDVDAERVDELRTQASDLGITLPDNDKVLYVTRILCETGLDLATLRDAIIRKSQPTEEAVAEAVERFPAHVSES